MIEEILRDIDFSSIFDNLNNFIEDCKIKKFRRKFRRNNKIYYSREIFFYNPVRDLIVDNLAFSLKWINRLRK